MPPQNPTFLNQKPLQVMGEVVLGDDSPVDGERNSETEF
jgi:hypothetical protein